jgi:hypothetical protein
MVRFVRTVRVAGCWSNIGPTLQVVPRFVERIRSWPGVAGCTASVSMTGPTATIYFMTTCSDMAALQTALAHSAADEQYAALHKQYDAMFEWSSMHDVMLQDIA